MAAIIEDIKQSFKQGTALTKVIYINLAVFILVNLIGSLAYITSSAHFELTPWLAVPAHFPELITKPWTLITYMFLHEQFLHILFNLLWLYFAGRIFEDLLGQRRFISTYILGGLSGGLLFIAAYNVFPVFNDVLPVARAMGASASVLAIIVAIGTKVPNYTVNLLFIGPVKLKYIAIVSVILDLISFQDGNAGGHIAHLGGAAFGFFYIRQLDRGRDWSYGFFQFFDALGSIFASKPKPGMKVTHKKSQPKTATHSSSVDQETIDLILDKISKSGYDSLNKDEKDILFKASQHK